MNVFTDTKTFTSEFRDIKTPTLKGRAKPLLGDNEVSLVFVWQQERYRKQGTVAYQDTDLRLGLVRVTGLERLILFFCRRFGPRFVAFKGCAGFVGSLITASIGALSCLAADFFLNTFPPSHFIPPQVPRARRWTLGSRAKL